MCMEVFLKPGWERESDSSKKRGESTFLALIIWKRITHLKILFVCFLFFFNSWRCSGSISISHIHLKRVVTYTGDLKIQYLHLQFPLFKVFFGFIISLEKTLQCVEVIFSLFFFFFFFWPNTCMLYKFIFTYWLKRKIRNTLLEHCRKAKMPV